MSYPVIVTRTQPGADETADRLRALGYRAIVSPMLHIVETGLDPHVLEGIRDIVFTSANGVRAFRSAGVGAGEMTAWCVGPSTAETARAAGFGEVVEGDGDAADLARLILGSHDRLSGPVLHIANNAAAGNLVNALRIGGLNARFAAPYHTEAAPSLSAEALDALAAGPAAILIHSAKAADALAHAKAPLETAMIVAISPAAAAPLEGLPSGAVHVAERPNEDALMTALAAAAPA
ncbi:MAG: uroporphyrinogen-III synthase [Hyphomonas sp.]